MTITARLISPKISNWSALAAFATPVTSSASRTNTSSATVSTIDSTGVPCRPVLANTFGMM